MILSSLDTVCTDKLGVRTEKGILKHRKKVKEETMPIMVCNGSRAIKLIETQMLKNLGKWLKSLFVLICFIDSNVPNTCVYITEKLRKKVLSQWF